jgi:hypothetical protein
LTDGAPAYPDAMKRYIIDRAAKSMLFCQNYYQMLRRLLGLDFSVQHPFHWHAGNYKFGLIMDFTPALQL